jgi:hypothetical protein
MRGRLELPWLPCPQEGQTLTRKGLRPASLPIPGLTLPSSSDPAADRAIAPYADCPGYVRLHQLSVSVREPRISGGYLRVAYRPVGTVCDGSRSAARAGRSRTGPVSVRGFLVGVVVGGAF